VARSKPVRAPDDVKCEKGGKHTPTTRESREDGIHMKRRICTKCDKIV
jgi:hypothetical protein